MHKTAAGQKPLVILPTYNERENIVAIVEAIRSTVPHVMIWVVDDNSPDGTGQMADEMAATDPQIQVIHRPRKEGLGIAYVDAFQRALVQDFDAVLQMDADFSHDPCYLPVLLATLEDADLVIGSRYTAGGGTKNWSPLRQVISRGGNLVARIGLNVRVRDATGGYRVYRRSTLEALEFDELKLRGYGFQIEVVYQVERLGLRIKEVPIVFAERVAGTSKMSLAIMVEAMMHIVRQRLRAVRRRGHRTPGL
jgi:dolichol-phosphate mannosyltransferase